MRWYCFEVRRFGRNLYIGKCETTLEEIKAAFPHAYIQGNLVTLLSRP